MTYFNHLLRLFNLSSLKDPMSPTRYYFAMLLNQCPNCKFGVTGHLWCRLASAFIENTGRTQELAGLIGSREWKRASEFQDWNADKSEQEYLLLRCPETSLLTLLTVISRHELFVDDELLSVERLDADTSKVLTDFVGERWMTI